MIDADLLSKAREAGFEDWVIADHLDEFEELARLITGMKPVDFSPVHTFKPHPKYFWFCESCGYSKHELLMHHPEGKII